MVSIHQFFLLMGLAWILNHLTGLDLHTAVSMVQVACVGELWLPAAILRALTHDRRCDFAKEREKGHVCGVVQELNDFAFGSSAHMLQFFHQDAFFHITLGSGLRGSHLI